MWVHIIQTFVYVKRDVVNNRRNCAICKLFVSLFTGRFVVSSAPLGHCFPYWRASK